MTPPFTSRLRQAMTHKGIMEMGAEIEGKFQKKYEVQLENALYEKQKQMKREMERMIKEAVVADRQAQQLIHNLILEKASSDLSKSYQVISCVDTMPAQQAGVQVLYVNTTCKTTYRSRAFTIFRILKC